MESFGKQENIRVNALEIVFFQETSSLFIGKRNLYFYSQ